MDVYRLILTTCYSRFGPYKRHRAVQPKLVKNQLSAKLWPTLLPLSWEVNHPKIIAKLRKNLKKVRVSMSRK